MDTKREHRTHAEGSPRGNPYDLTYSPSGRLTGKYRDNSSATLSASANMVYGYCDDYQPHAVKRMFDYNSGLLYDMRWDEEKSSGLFDSVAENKSAGNLGQVSMAKPGEMFETGRFLFWTEDSAVQSERRTNSFVIPSQNSVGVANRMHAAVDDRCYSYYAYDHSGERRLKLVGDNKLLDVNADFMATYTILNEPTLYPSSYMVLTNRGYTKHYYAGTERVAARLGGGGLDALYHVIGNDVELQKKADILFKQSLEQVNHRVLHENNLECIKNNEFTKEELRHWIDGIPHQMKAGVELDHSQLKDMVHSMLVDLNNGQEKEVYFYHSDLCKSRGQSQAGLSYAETQQSVRSKHLGSASWITDYSGTAVQHLQYLPFGEPFVDQRVAGSIYNERFTFTGKGPRQGWRTPLNNIIYSEQRDEETGNGYFGARYMDHELMTMWLSVDPMADKYPGLSPYAYCAWNPVKLVDPDGEEIWIICCEKKFQYKPGMSSEGMDGFAKLSVDALNSIYNSGEEGGQLINILSCSNNIFNISKQDDGKLSNFQPDNPMGAYCRNNKSIVEHWQEYVGRGKEISSGGEIKWSTDGYNIMTSEGLINSPAFHLLHELCHAYDANQGTMYGTEYLGLSRNEWSACIRSNRIGLSMGYPIQTHYGGVIRNGKFVNGVNLLDENYYPINPF